MMSKKAISIILAILGISLVILALVFVIKRNKKEETVAPLAEEEPSSQLPIDKGELKTYNDEAGFSFDYSDTLGIKEVENQDDSTYSWLEITAPGRSGEKITIKVTDTNLTTVDGWLTKNKQTDGVASEAVLSGMNGKIINSPTKIISVAIQKGILFLIESPADSEGFWEKQHEIIGDSFKVAWPTPKQSTAPAGDSSGIEEIIE